MCVRKLLMMRLMMMKVMMMMKVVMMKVIAYTGSAAQYQCVVLLGFCGFGMFLACLPVCVLSIVEHANANK